MKLLIFLAVWKRPEITEICFMGIERLRKSSAFEIEAFAVISEVSMIPLCEKYNVDYCITDNSPLGAKKNFGLTEAYKKDWEYLIEIGSDDVLKDEYLEVMAPHFGKRNVLGIDHIAFVNSEDGECISYKSKETFGLGRAISRKVFDKIGTTLWDNDINRGLDRSSVFQLARHGFGETKICSDVPLGVDIKSETNIWKFNSLIGTEYPLEAALIGLSEDETNGIMRLINSACLQQNTR